MFVTTIGAEEFLLETKRWGISDKSLIRVRMMQHRGFVHLRFAVPHTVEVLQTIMTKKEYDDFQFINLAAISVPAVWFDDSDKLSQLIKLMEGLNANTKPTAPDWDKSIRSGQQDSE